LVVIGLVAELSPWLAAILPLAGVALGALIGFGWTYGLKRRDERRELRAVARLLDDELAVAQAILEWKWAPYSTRGHLEPELELSATVWKEHQLLLARHLDEEDWSTLAIAYAALTGTSLAMSIERVKRSMDEQLPKSDKRVERMFRAIGDARDTCQRHGGPGAVEIADRAGWLPKLAFLPPGRNRDTEHSERAGADTGERES
jgi:hypothetical protein